MLEAADERTDPPRTLEELVLAMDNCLSSIGSGCYLIEEAVEAGRAAEIRGWLAEMRDRLEKAARLTRAVPLFVTAARSD